jgi:hypothetical protein
MNKTVAQQIKEQFDDMLQRGTIPCFEYQIAEDDWLVVDIELHPKGIKFLFDDRCIDKPVFFFSGNVKQLHPENFGCYLMPFDDWVNDLDSYIQAIDQEMTEGFLLPNNLFYTEQE